jgi:hypothetical protein
VLLPSCTQGHPTPAFSRAERRSQRGVGWRVSTKMLDLLIFSFAPPNTFSFRHGIVLA